MSNEQKRYESNSRSSGIALFFNLLMSNDQDARCYREAAASTTDPEVEAYLTSLAKHRQSLYEGLFDWLSDLPPSPLPMSKQGRSYLHENKEAFLKAVNDKNQSKIVEHCLASEQAISEDYQTAVAQSGVVPAMHDFVEKQHKHVLGMMPHVERMEVVPTF